MIYGSKRMDDVIEERKNKLIEKLNLKKNWYWFIFVIVAWLGYWIRTRNLSLLIDVTRKETSMS